MKRYIIFGLVYLSFLRAAPAIGVESTSTSYKLQPTFFDEGGPGSSLIYKLKNSIGVSPAGIIHLGIKYAINSSLLLMTNAAPTVSILNYNDDKSIQDVTPTFKWSYSDKDADPQRKFQFQISRDNFATTVLDTGLVSSSNQYYTTALLSILQANVAYKWRVRTFDGYEHSGWTLAGTGFRFGIRQEELLIATLLANRDILGAAIEPAAWQADRDPYFYWDIADTGIEIKGFSYSLNSSPDDVVDTVNKYYQVPLNGLADGRHTFFVKAQDTAGLWTGGRSFEVWVDTASPQVTDFNPKPGALINDDRASIVLSLADQHSGIDSESIALKVNGVKVATKYDLNVNQVIYEPMIPWSEGRVVATFDVSDMLGNSITPILWEFIVDTTSPRGSIIINNGAALTHSTNVSLTIQLVSVGEDESPITEMILSNDELFDTEKWEPFKTTRTWTLPAINGERKVFVKFRDTAGNVSLVASDSIILSIKAPDTIITAGPSGVVDFNAAYFAFRSTKAGSTFKWRFDTEAWSDWTSQGYIERTGLIDGNHYFEVISGKDLNDSGSIDEDEIDPSPAIRVWTVSTTGLIPPAQLPPEEPTKYWRTE